MKKRKILTRPTAISNMQFYDFDFDMGQFKAERLHARALRKLRHKLA